MFKLGFSRLQLSKIYKLIRNKNSAACYCKINTKNKIPKMKKSNEKIKIGYFTDVEGNFNYWQNYLKYSKVIRFNKETNKIEFQKPSEEKEQQYFVFGGDTFDKGNGDIRLCEMLIDFKERYPQNVFLIIGNRDLGKIKFTSELHFSEFDRELEDIPGPYWVPDNRQTTYKMYLKKLLQEKGEKLQEDSKDFSKLQYKTVFNKFTKLQWLMKHTLGMNDCWQFRREELAILQEKKEEEISEDEVFDSFLNSVLSEDGFIYRYLKNANIAAIIGNTIFVHGAINSESLGWIPSYDNKDWRQDSTPGKNVLQDCGPHGWVDQLNQFCKDGLKSCILILKQKGRENLFWNKERNHRGGSFLMGYSYSASSGRKTCLVRTFLDNEHNPEFMDVESATILKEAGIHRVAVGHTPFGMSPTFMIKDDVEVVMGDTSYSDPTALDNRGTAVSEIVIEGTKDQNKTFVTGILSDGTEIEFDVNSPSAYGYPSKKHEDSLIGKQTKEGYWIKAKKKNFEKEENLYQISKGSGHDVKYSWLTAKEILELL